MHWAAQSSFFQSVNTMWNLCKAPVKPEKGEFYRSASARFGTDFSHEGFVPKVVTIGRFVKFSTSPTCLLLLLVLKVLYLI